MTATGPCPIFEGLISVCSFFFPDADMNYLCTEIGANYGPIDIAMIPIRRGGIFSLIARLGFRVRFPSPPSHLTKD